MTFATKLALAVGLAATGAKLADFDQPPIETPSFKLGFATLKSCSALITPALAPPH